MTQWNQNIMSTMFLMMMYWLKKKNYIKTNLLTIFFRAIIPKFYQTMNIITSKDQ